MAAAANALIGFVGDVLINRTEPKEIFSEVRDVLRAPAILFANLEGVYTDAPASGPSGPAAIGAPAHILDVYAESGFSVMSLANNHIMDAGPAAMLENRSRLRKQGIRTCGAGENVNDAREPAVFNVGGLRIAFLAYASIFPKGAEARADRPGLAPMRAQTHWHDPFPSMYAPGFRPVISTVPDESDLLHLTEDIQRARSHCDVVITSFHWGDHTRSFHLTDHELRTARYCIDHGADMVVGHHHHALRGMEWYKGKPILYGLGHFVFDFQWKMSSDFLASELGRYFRQIEFLSDGVPEGWPLLPMPADARMTMMAWAKAGKSGIDEIGFLPCRLTPDGRVHPLRLGTAESEEVIRYIDKCNKSQGLSTFIVADGALTLAGFQTLRVVPG